jgi:hypothetical protein
MLILYCLKLPSDLLQVDREMDLVIDQHKDDATDPWAKSLEAQAWLHLLPKLDNHLPHNISMEDFSGQAPK